MKAPRIRPSRLLLLAALLGGSALSPAAAPDPATPHIVFIMADDMGYGDVRALNPDSDIPTPHLDRLAGEGMTFTDAHSPSAVCTPTRYGVVTGRYCWRSRLKRGVLNGYSPPLIDPDRETVASFLGKAGYHTAVIGKWHLGLGFVKKGKAFDWSQPLTSSPNDNGFAYSYVIPASLDFPPYVYVENKRLTALPTEQQPARKFPAFLRKGERSPDLVMDECLHHLTARAVAHIGERAKEKTPYFLYFPLTAPHKPVLPHPDFRGKHPLGWYADFVRQVDWTVGQVLEAVDQSSGAGNTLVVYTSDNGSFMYSRDAEPDHAADHSVQAYKPGNHRANGPLRGTKADVWEAGHRVPFFARWPGVIAPGSRCAETITHTDLFATCADLVKRPLPEQAAEDSFSWLPLFKGLDWERAPVINHSAAGMFALRDGTWKLVLGDGSGGRENPRGKPFRKPYALFDLESDLGERNDVSAQHPERVERMAARCRELIDRGRSR